VAASVIVGERPDEKDGCDDAEKDRDMRVVLPEAEIQGYEQ
jgi:hypothetical protein